MRMLLVVGTLLAIGCGDGMMMMMGSGYAGVYTASYTGTFNNTTPFPQSGSNTENGLITVSDEPNNQVKLTWQVGTNPASGVIVFNLNGSTGTMVAGTGTTGTCFNGKISNGNTQTSCCKTCTVSFNGKMLIQTQQGDYTGVTPQNIAYSGNYSGTWTGLRP